jgi:hypothetical protein
MVFPWFLMVLLVFPWFLMVLLVFDGTFHYSSMGRRTIISNEAVLSRFFFLRDPGRLELQGPSGHVSPPLKRFLSSINAPFVNKAINDPFIV